MTSRSPLIEADDHHVKPEGREIDSLRHKKEYLPMPKALLASYYDERIEALKSLIADAPDAKSKMVYTELLARYKAERARLDRDEDLNFSA